MESHRGTSTKEAPSAARQERDERWRGPTLSAEEARQGEIILKTPLRRAIFIGGLLLAAVVCVLLFYAGTR